MYKEILNNRTHLSGDDGGVSVRVPRAISDSLMALARTFEFAGAAAGGGGEVAAAAVNDADDVIEAEPVATLRVPPAAVSHDSLW